MYIYICFWKALFDDFMSIVQEALFLTIPLYRDTINIMGQHATGAADKRKKE